MTTQVTVFEDPGGTPLGLRAEGHTGRRDNPEQAGVCNSITTVFEIVSRATADLPEQSLSLHIDPQATTWELLVHRQHLPRETWPEVRRLLMASCSYLFELREQSPSLLNVRSRPAENFRE